MPSIASCCIVLYDQDFTLTLKTMLISIPYFPLAEDWDMDDAVRTGQLIEISEFWVYRKSDHLALDNGPENDHTNLTGYWPVSDRGGGK